MNNKLKQLTKKKQQLDKLGPLSPELLTNLEEWFKVELTYSSNAIEGNTLSRIETAEVIERGVETVKHSLDAYINAAKGKLASGEKLIKIGELATAIGETVHTIRFWTQKGLLQVKGYTKGGYQLYEPSMIKQVKEIRRLQNEERLTITEIKKKLEMS